ncbi:MAG TPA: hypothetical protein VK605_04550 [Solirubrobacteraceae bacterium]|nr:hypothetical protein [Solirubrobacteraceae bacterium]
MSTRPASAPLALCLVLCALALCSCANPDGPVAGSGTSPVPSPHNAGEPPAPAPPSPGAQAPSDVQPTATKALLAFAMLYVNWTYRTLGEHQRTLGAMAVGAARLSERQAAASSTDDQSIARGHIFNRGQIVSIAHDLSRPAWWVIVTHEQTGGSTQYEGLAAAYHVTTARLAGVPGGYAVEQWLPQS